MKILNTTYNHEQNKSDFENEDSLIEELPPELLFEILTKLNGQGFQSAVEVNKRWNLLTIKAARQKVFSTVKNYAKYLGENLPRDSFEIQLDRLSHLGSNKNLSNFESLRQIESSINELNEDFLNILKDFNEEDFKKLKNLPKETRPTFFKNLFKLARLYKEIDQANYNPNLFIKISSLEKLALKLVRLNRPNKVVDVADLMSKHNEYAAYNLITLALALAKRGYADQTVQVIEKIHDFFNIGVIVTIQKISVKLAKKGHTTHAIRIANKLDKERIHTLLVISQKLIKKNKFDEIVGIAWMITHDEHKEGKDESLITIAADLARKGRIDSAAQDQAVLILNMMSNIEAAVEFLVRTSDADRALVIPDLICDVSKKTSVLKAISIVFAQGINADRAVEIAKMIPESPEKSAALEAIAKELIRYNKIAQAIEVANLIPDESLRTNVLEMLS